MSWHLYLRDDGDIPLRGIFHKITDLFLCVIPSVGLSVVDSRSQRAYDGLFPPLSFLCQQRVFLYLQTPTLILGKVPMEPVHLVQRHQVDVPFQEVDVEVMQAAVQMHSTITEPR